MYMQNIIALGMISLFTWGCGNSDKQKGETVQTPLEDKVWYSNPVIDSDNPDSDKGRGWIFLSVRYGR